MYHYWHAVVVLTLLVVTACTRAEQIAPSGEVQTSAATANFVTTLPEETIALTETENLSAENHMEQSSQEPTDTSEITAPVLIATVVPTATAENAPVDWLATASREGNVYILGNPNAPIRLNDYSDFL